jgi:cell division septum initiation protein DivIVA
VDTTSAKAAFDSASNLAEWATIAVAAGVLIELAALFIFSGEMPPVEKRVMVFATLLIVGGCVGEYIFGSRATQAASELQSAQDKEVAALGKETADADLKAADAINRAAAAQLELARMKEPRKINTDQMRALVETLKEHAGAKFWVATEAATGIQFGEQINLAGQISSAFLNAGWIKSNRTMIDQTKVEAEFTQVSDRGCQIDFAVDADSRKLGEEVEKAFRDAGLDCVESSVGEIVPGLIEFELGLR